MYFQSHFYTSIHSLTLNFSNSKRFHFIRVVLMCSMFILFLLLLLLLFPLLSFTLSLHRKLRVRCTVCVHYVCMYKSICLFGPSYILLSLLLFCIFFFLLRLRLSSFLLIFFFCLSLFGVI